MRGYTYCIKAVPYMYHIHSFNSFLRWMLYLLYTWMAPAHRIVLELHKWYTMYILCGRMTESEVWDMWYLPLLSGFTTNRRLWAQKWNEVRRSQGCDEEKTVNIYQRRYFRSGRSFCFRGNILFMRFTAHQHFILICRSTKMYTKKLNKK